MTKRPPTQCLAGKWFLSFVAQDGKARVPRWQGQIIGQIDSDRYLVYLRDWILGECSVMRVVPISDMVGWDFFESAEDLRLAYEGKYGQ